MIDEECATERDAGGDALLVVRSSWPVETSAEPLPTIDGERTSLMVIIGEATEKGADGDLTIVDAGCEVTATELSTMGDVKLKGRAEAEPDICFVALTSACASELTGGTVQVDVRLPASAFCTSGAVDTEAMRSVTDVPSITLDGFTGVASL
jgi:hypothetical protein